MLDMSVGVVNKTHSRPISWARVFGDARAHAGIGVQASAAQHQGVRSEMMGEIFVAHADDHRITPLAPSLDPPGHTQHGLRRDWDVDEVYSRFGDERCSRQVAWAAVVHGSPDGGGAVSFTKPPQLATLRFEQSSGT